MCGRFRLEISPKDIIGFYRLIEELDKKYRNSKDVFNVSEGGRDYFPSSMVPLLSKEGEEKVQWGFPMDKKLLINGRSETVFEKPYYSKMIRNGRCIIPASLFYEWNEGRKYTIETEDSFFFMAGLKGRVKTSDEKVEERLLILTTDADKDMSRIHHRMPVILTRDRLADYLDPEASDSDIREMLQPWNRGLSIVLAEGEQMSFLDL